MTLLSSILAVTETEPVGPSNVGLGAVVVSIAVVALLSWTAYLIAAGRRRRRKAEETPQNLQPYLSDDELEVTRITRVLGAAVISAAVLAIALPVYYVDEANRQERAADAFVEQDIEAGHEWWEKFVCTECHGPTAGGGGAPFVEKRSGLDVAWTAPSLNDVFFRLSEEEVRQVIVNGRSGTPMAPAGLEGGGAMTVQEIDQVIAFVGSLQISQGEALAKIDGAVSQALSRVTSGDAVVANLLLEQQARAADIEDAAAVLEAHTAFLSGHPAFASAAAANPNLRLNEAMTLLLSEDGTCTDETAALVRTSCSAPGEDTDRDHITDAAEAALTDLAAEALTTLTTRKVSTNGQVSAQQDEAFGITFDADNGFTNSDATGSPIADLDELDAFLSAVNSAILNTTVIADRVDRFMATVDQSLSFLEDAQRARAWIPQGVRLDEVTAGDGSTTLEPNYTNLAATLGTSAEDAQRALGLFNGYCARCHTAGYSAGVAFEQGPGSGAWGPALTDGRTIVQFPDEADHVSFVTRGTDTGVGYGVNGLGTGRMPGFGQILSAEDIALIVTYERSL